MLTDSRERPAFGGSALTSIWFPGVQADVAAPVQLICLSYAGGTPSVYRDWPRYLADHVQVVPVLLPGRGLRLSETPYTRMEPLVGDIATALTGCGLTGSYALFGHSMGALVAYELARELRRRGEPEPLHLFVSGSKAPHLYCGEAGHALSDDDLRQLTRSLGGLGVDNALGAAYLERRMPVLRADLAVCESYRWVPRKPLACPMTAFSAAEDPIATAHQVEEWRDHTQGSMIHRQLPGNHFSVTGTARFQLLGYLRAELDQLRPAAGVLTSSLS